jgi:regulator of protease activity HflC (stomatin/prohibitin superfamily)
MITEKTVRPLSGMGMLVALLGGMVAAGLGFAVAVSGSPPEPLPAVACVLAGFALLVCLFGLFVVNPNEARVLTLFGTYRGSVKEPGFYWVNPFTSKKPVSLRLRNFETGQQSTPELKDAAGKVTQSATHQRRATKVNDRDGNPIEIAAIVGWRVVDTAAALLTVDRYEDYVHLQSESALRNLATQYHYDSEDDATHSLRTNTGAIAEALVKELQTRLAEAGVQVQEARISHLAYAPEIAAAMLQRQQATAMIAARTKIVEGAVGMVEMALAQLKDRNVVELDAERKAAMVGNLLVVLCGNANAHPVVNAGTLY